MPVPVGIGTAGYGGFITPGDKSPFVSTYPATKHLHGHPSYRAAVVSRGPGHEVVFLRGDMVGVFQQFRRAVVLELEKRLGREMDHVLLFGATHTHSGPGRLINGGGVFDLIADQFFEEFYLRMVDAAADVVQQAYDDLKPGRIGIAVTREDTAIGDRRCEDGKDYVNGTMPLLALEQEGKLRAVVFSYSIHGTALNIDDFTLSQDVSGAIEEAAAQTFDHPVLAIFFNSWAADITASAPKSVKLQTGADQPGGYDKMEKVGLVVGQALKNAVKKVKWDDQPRIGLHTYRARIDREVIGYAKGVFPYKYGGVYCGQNKDADCDAKTKITDLDQYCIPFNKTHPAPNQTEITVGELGDFYIVTFPGEAGTLLGEAVVAGVKKFVPDKQMMFLGYAQDYLGYSILEEDWWQGGYESSGALWGPRQGAYLLEQVLAAAKRHTAGDHSNEGEPDPVLPFDVPKFEAYVPTAPLKLGTVVEQVKAQYKQTDTVVFAVAGSDPWLGTPVATLVDETGKPVLNNNQTAIESDSYGFYVDLTMDPKYDDDRKAKSRRFTWRFNMPVAHKVAAVMPQLKGKYKLQVKLPIVAGKSKEVVSKVFEVGE